VIALVLWVATTGLGLLDILASWNILLGIYARSQGDYWAAVNMIGWSVVVMGLVWMVVVAGGGEYHHTRVGQCSSWRLFGWTIGRGACLALSRRGETGG
jgi:hypothetical protein